MATRGRRRRLLSRLKWALLVPAGAVALLCVAVGLAHALASRLGWEGIGDVRRRALAFTIALLLGLPVMYVCAPAAARWLRGVLALDEGPPQGRHIGCSLIVGIAAVLPLLAALGAGCVERLLWPP